MDEKYQENLALYQKLVQAIPDIELKGVTMPYTSVNGHMFSQLNKAGNVGIRLPKEEREQFMAQYKAKPFESYGAIMREYVEVPQELLQQTGELQPYFELSFQYASSLKPKSTKKR